MRYAPTAHATILDGMESALPLGTLGEWTAAEKDTMPVDALRAELARVAVHQAQEPAMTGRGHFARSVTEVC